MVTMYLVTFFIITLFQACGDFDLNTEMTEDLSSKESFSEVEDIKKNDDLLNNQTDNINNDLSNQRSSVQLILEIVGKGDFVSANKQGCSALSSPCALDVSKNFADTYKAKARDGWVLEKFEGCKDSNVMGLQLRLNENECVVATTSDLSVSKAGSVLKLKAVFTQVGGVVDLDPIKTDPVLPDEPVVPSGKSVVFYEDFDRLSQGSQWSRNDGYKFIGKGSTKVIKDPTGNAKGNVFEVTLPAGNSGMIRRFGLSKQSENACLYYDVYFEKGFEFGKGKLPGLAGGDGPTGCIEAKNGFSNRFIWQPGGVIHQYQYFPDKNQRCGVHTTVGSVQTEKWYAIKSCIDVGTPGVKDGTWQSWINDQTIGKRNIEWREKNSVLINTIWFQLNYTNHILTKQVKAYFDNFRVVEE